MSIKEDILTACDEEGLVTSKTLQERLGLARQTIDKHLAGLVEEGLLVKRGLLRDLPFHKGKAPIAYTRPPSKP